MRALLRRLHSAPALVFYGTFMLNLSIAWFNYSTYRFWNFDLAWQTQVVSDYSQLQWPIVTMIGDDYEALGNHFSPALALAAPLYALFPSSFTLNVLMAGCFALAAAIVTASAAKRLSTASALFIGFGLGAGWGFISASEAGFHEYALGAPLLAYSLSQFLEGRYGRAALVAASLVLVKEDMGLLLIGLGIVFALRAKQWRWLALALFGAVSVYATVKIIIPAISGQWEFSGFVSLTGETLFADAGFKLTLVAFLMLQSGIIGLRSPLLYALIPLLAGRLFTAWPAYYVLGYHYDVLTSIVASYALVDALSRWSWSKNLARGAIALPLLASLLYVALPTPGNANSWLTRDYSQDRAVIAAYEGLYDTVAPQAIVAADNVSVLGFIERGYRTYFITAAFGREEPPDCVVNESEQINGPGDVPYSSLQEFEREFDRSYELVYESPYVNAWCSPETIELP